jgi:putative spermidine/putrescine transport system substrate-binding protein
VSAAPATLRVLSWAGGWGRALRGAVSDPFERETGVRVEHVTHVGLHLPATLLQALAAEQVPAVHVVWCNSVPALHAEQRGYCVPLESNAELDALRPRAWPQGCEQRSVVHPYVVYYVLAYHEAACPQGAPRSWHELFEPRHRGKIALYPGGNGFYPLAQVLGGGCLPDIPGNMTACWSYLRRLRPHIGELDYSIGMETRLQRGDLHLCFRALTNALAFRASGLPVAWCVPDEGTTDTVDALWVPRGLPAATQELARRYVLFALRRDIQTQWCRQLGAMPVHGHAEIPDLLRTRDDLPAHADDYHGILHIAESLKVEHQIAWEARFEEIFREPGVRSPSNESAT